MNDIEHDRRAAPSDFLIKQFAEILNLNLDLLYHRAGQIPPDIRSLQEDDKKVVDAYKAFRKNLKGT